MEAETELSLQLFIAGGNLCFKDEKPRLSRLTYTISTHVYILLHTFYWKVKSICIQTHNLHFHTSIHSPMSISKQKYVFGFTPELPHYVILLIA